ncbi:MAG TPA: phosphoribosylaminoimidazolesuccinocarboxamide synthase [Kiritimatiellia bacterium]|nr:phosphoribosylaminoimidazolesuccinocarboxamide synthase [Kiritimatiellia bacterium]HRZ13723.1 phosphoribosylaminoimidazolesuccinocarboxamide synthase [Kiritimatiellia bacterium]HSA19369.1 phosphoribosylaminoimidazolesuccinocarboxamide synthase [Kiritimatiellia bacterium]
MTTLTQLDLPGIPKLRSGKVREVFDLGDRLLMVATDRISAFDCILPTGIPQKGEVLNRLSAWWFERTAAIVPNHVIALDPSVFPERLRPFEHLLRGRAMLVRKAKPLPVECVVRGYLIGSGWKDYTRTGSVCGLPLRAGCRLADRLDEPLFTPARKADTGHDENIPFGEVEKMIGPELAARLRAVSLALYEHAAGHARTRGIIIADTKFEFGLDGNELILIDELFTPDSSRFWPADSYAPGRSPPSFDKQFVRDYLETLDWDKTPPAPPLSDDVVRKTREKYLEAYRRITEREDIR